MTIELRETDKNTACWAKLVADAKDELAKLREQNDGQLDALATAGLRGQIAQVKRLLKMNDDKPVIPVSDLD